MTHALLKLLANETSKLQQAGLYKSELVFGADGGSGEGIDFTGHDYLGLGRDPQVRDAAIAAVREHGHGLSDSRGFGGTRSTHKRLEQAIAAFVGQPDAILFGTGYLANIGLFDSLFDSRDAIFCDAWVHPSSAEGARLSGARAIPYRQDDMEDLEDKLKRSRAARFRAIVTDGVFPFSGNIAALQEICGLAERYDALVVVDDCLGAGVVGEHGRGTCELCGVTARVHMVIGSFSKGLGGAAGGYVAGGPEIVEWLRQKSTPYLFSGALPPAMVGAAMHAVERVTRGEVPLATLRARIAALRSGLREAGFTVGGKRHPILTVRVGDAVTLQKMVNNLFETGGIRTHGLCYPVVPERDARIRIQVSASHTEHELDRAIDAFKAAGRAVGVL